MAVELDELFDRKRLPSYLDYFPLFFYFPLGLCLAIVRFFIGIQAVLLSSTFAKFPTLRRYLLRIMYVVLGFIMLSENSENFNEHVRIIVSNHITVYDHLPVNLLISVIVPSVWNLPPYLNWILGYADFAASEGKQVLIQNVQNYIKSNNVPVLIFPEGATTNSKKGLLKFNYWPFLLSDTVQPITIKVHRPAILNVATSLLGSRWWSDMFWFLFVPYSVFTVKFLPVARRGESETVQDFCIKVQKMISKDLGLQETNFTSSDKVEYAKLVLKVPPEE